LPRIKSPFLDQPAIHFATTLTELGSSYYIEAPRTSKNGSFKDYKILYYNNTIFSFIWINSANTKENNTQESKTSSQTAVEITTLRTKKE
jgi:hypothetical protein